MLTDNFKVADDQGVLLHKELEDKINEAREYLENASKVLHDTMFAIREHPEISAMFRITDIGRVADMLAYARNDFKVIKNSIYTDRIRRNKAKEDQNGVV